ncbi:MFS transporter [Prochlorococcus marinus]|uniref:MFS transporter n=1 Tax=Prochlorococcus marinus TaxID=1219 RepID=UPI0022B4E9EF|nr:MFS transporter [Prochlorococcus marinus]
MTVLKTTTKLRKWWNQFPSNLRIITICRFLASIGAGGVLYLTPLIFNDLSFSATEIGIGFVAAAFAGTITRFSTGVFLDKGISFSLPLRIAGILAITADLFLLIASTKQIYFIGEFFLGAAAGIYWPSVELAIPTCCDKNNSNKGFALARSADALGITTGALIGSIAASFNYIRFIYINEAICMLILISIVQGISFKSLFQSSNKQKNHRKEERLYTKRKELNDLLKLIAPILILSILSTGILSLMQIALQLDIANGGIYRPGINGKWTTWIISFQLTLLPLIQWPIGYWLTKRNFIYGFKISLLSFSLGCLLLSLSSLFSNGIFLLIIALIPISIGIASYLPTGTEAIFKVSPIKYKGLGMALYSQTFGISFLIFPLVAGKLIDSQGNAMLLWLIISFTCIVAYPITNYIERTRII